MDGRTDVIMPIAVVMPPGLFSV